MDIARILFSVFLVIFVLLLKRKEDLDGRDEPGHDDVERYSANLSRRHGRLYAGHPRPAFCFLDHETAPQTPLDLAVSLRRTHQAIAANFTNLSHCELPVMRGRARRGEKYRRAPEPKCPRRTFSVGSGREDVMRLYALLAIYLTAAISLVGGVVATLISLAGPVGSEPSSLSRAKIASADSASQIIVEPHQQAFRYGPEINHGPSDTPVNARQQALKEARALAPAVKIKRPRGHQEPVIHHRPMTREPGLSVGLAPSVPSSGH